VERGLRSTAEASATFLRLTPPDVPGRRLICLPFAGGGAATYRHWPRSLPEDLEVAAVQLPGRDLSRRGEPLDSIGAMAMAAHIAVRSASDLPYALFGHSLGALVAFELALALERDGGRPPVALFVSGRRPPDQVDTAPPVHALADTPFLDELQRRYGGIPDVVRQEPELLALLLPALRADVRALETYQPAIGARVACQVHVYGGRGDTMPRPDELAGWERSAQRPVRTRVFAGGHFFVEDERAAICADIAAQWAAEDVMADRT